MTSPIPGLLTVMHRVEKLERQNRRIKRAGILGVVIVAAALIMGQATSKPRILEGEGFVLRDKNGRTRAELTTNSNGDVGLYIYNPQGTKEVKDAFKETGSEYKGEPDVALELSAKGSPSLKLGRILGPNAKLHVSPGGWVGFDATSPKEGKHVSLGVGPDSDSGLWLGWGRKRGIRLAYSLRGEPLLGIVELDWKKKPLKEKILAGLGISDQGNPSVFVSDKEGNIRGALFTKDDGTTSLTSYDERGAVLSLGPSGSPQQASTWVLWAQGMFAFGNELRPWTVARGAWPNQSECEAARKLSQQEANKGEPKRSAVVFTCLPDNVNLSGKQ